MNWMTLIAIIFGLAAILAGYVALIFRDRAREMETQDDALLEGQRAVIEEQGKLIQQQRRCIGNLSSVIDEFVEAADAMNDCNVELERRNFYLEARRNVILSRWWRKRTGQHRRLVTWRARKGFGQ